jgi:hypothetical protein
MRIFGLFQSASFPFEFSPAAGDIASVPDEVSSRQEKPWHVLGWLDDENQTCGMSRGKDAFAVQRAEVEKLFSVVVTPAKGPGYVQLSYKPRSQQASVHLLHTSYRSDAVDWLHRNANDLSEIFGQELKMIDGGADY